MKFVALFLLFLPIYSVFAAKVNIVFQEPSNKTESEGYRIITQSEVGPIVAEFVNERFDINRNLEIHFGAADGPLYDSELNQIWIPYYFVTETESHFTSAKYSHTGTSAQTATIDALMHTLFHEIAHALIEMHDLPIVGKEEDAADSLATVLLLDYFEDGQEIALSAADLFELESSDIDELNDSDFWSEHSLDLQRYFQTLCLVYGSDPENYQFIVDTRKLSQERADQCVFEYEDTSSNWSVLLKNLTKASE